MSKPLTKLDSDNFYTFSQMPQDKDSYVADYRPTMCKCEYPMQGTQKYEVGVLTHFCKTCGGIIGKERVYWKDV